MKYDGVLDAYSWSLSVFRFPAAHHYADMGGGEGVSVVDHLLSMQEFPGPSLSVSY